MKPCSLTLIAMMVAIWAPPSRADDLTAPAGVRPVCRVLVSYDGDFGAPRGFESDPEGLAAALPDAVDLAIRKKLGRTCPDVWPGPPPVPPVFGGESVRHHALHVAVTPREGLPDAFTVTLRLYELGRIWGQNGAGAAVVSAPPTVAQDGMDPGRKRRLPDMRRRALTRLQPALDKALTLALADLRRARAEAEAQPTAAVPLEVSAVGLRPAELRAVPPYVHCIVASAGALELTRNRRTPARYVIHARTPTSKAEAPSAAALFAQSIFDALPHDDTGPCGPPYARFPGAIFALTPTGAGLRLTISRLPPPD